MTIRAMIVDDEFHAREGIRVRLAEFPAIDIVGEASSGTEAVAAIDTLRPDLLFLDIQMPGLNGFEVLDKISGAPPIVIFVTAYDKYAVKAFQFHALDYLLKPIDEERFGDTIRSVSGAFKHRSLEKYADTLRMFMNDYYDVLDNELPSVHPPEERKMYRDRFMVKVKGVVSFVPASDIDWIESAGDYIYLHSGSKKYILRETMLRFEEKVDPAKFIRIHRSTIVNIAKIDRLLPNPHGDFDIFLVSGAHLKLSRKYRDAFRKAFGE